MGQGFTSTEMLMGVAAKMAPFLGLVLTLRIGSGGCIVSRFITLGDGSIERQLYAIAETSDSPHFTGDENKTNLCPRAKRASGD